MNTHRKAVSDTFMFVLGLSIGLLLNLMVNKIEKYITEKHHYFAAGIIQILINAFIIQLVAERMPIGLFVLGLLSSQRLLIKQCYIV